jgi:transposase
VIRTPLSRQRNKHIQSVLVEAAKLAPRHDHDLALVYENEKKKERQSSNASGSLARWLHI